MKHNKFVLNAIILSGTLGLITATAWSAGERGSGGTSSERVQPRSEGSSSREPGMPSSRESGMPSMKGGQESQEHSAETIKQVQQALKDKGHDPGSIDGIMGQRTQEALRSFQQKEGLKATGTLDEQSAKRLGVSVTLPGGEKASPPGRGGTADRSEK